MLAQFLYKPAYTTEKLLSNKICENYYSIYIEERGWVNAQVILASC